MRYELINKNDDCKLTLLGKVLYNRGIKTPEEMIAYLNTTDEKDINDFMTLGEDNLKAAAGTLGYAIQNNYNAIIIVDADCDGYTSSAVLINYLYKIFPTWVEQHVDWYLHDSKQHGLSDCCDWILQQKKYKLIILPDSSSNDEEYHKKLYNEGAKCIVLDHHIVDKLSEYAITVNNQMSDYPNKDFSGAGITWQFCRYFDSMIGTKYADEELDLVALGNCADMMSLLSKETKHIENKGFHNIKNPFIYSMWQKNKFKLGDTITHMGCAFYIAPFVNAITRSGTLEEKELVFKSMIKHLAFTKVLTDKRGHKGEEVDLVDEAILICDRVKRRQSKAETEGLEKIENLIKENNMLEHKVLLFLLDENYNIEPNLRGLIANKIMAKYQRPCAILTKTIIPPWEEGPEVLYQGSMRGYSGSGIESFKEICENTNLVEYCSGHDNAAGLGISEESIDGFIEATDVLLQDMRDEALYKVDCIFDDVDILPYDDMLDVASHTELWGQQMPEPLIALEKLNITKDMVVLMSPDKSPTLKIKLPNGIDMIKFKSSQEEYDDFMKTGSINMICKLNINEWNGKVNPQLIVEDYEWNVQYTNQWNF